MAKKAPFIERFASLEAGYQERYSDSLHEPAFGQCVTRDGFPVKGYENILWGGGLAVWSVGDILKGWDTYRAFLARKNGLQPVGGETVASYLERAVDENVISADPLDIVPREQRRALLRAIFTHGVWKFKVDGESVPLHFTLSQLLYVLRATSDLMRLKKVTSDVEDVFGKRMPKYLAKAGECKKYVKEMVRAENGNVPRPFELADEE